MYIIKKDIIYNFWIVAFYLQCCCNVVKGTYVVDTINQNLSRFQRETRCRIDQFQCQDRSCILEDTLCDGIADCPDGSDETSDCKELPCNSFYGFRCKYGACISKDARCNGIKECKDNSDETGCPSLKPISVSTCGITKFTCQSGDCIHNDKLCDGIADCPDNSDETEECRNFSCKNAFRCRYGGCAVLGAHCNGVKDCVDGSDEESCRETMFLSKPTPDKSGQCVIPKIPKHGIFVSSNIPDGKYAESDHVPNFFPLITKCNDGYKITPPNNSFPICINGKWSSTPLECARHCKSVSVSPHLTVRCKLNGIDLESCIDPVEKTIVIIKCSDHYEVGGSENTNRLCIDGTWDYPLPNCRPVCGKRPFEDADVFTGKHIAKKTDYPWSVGVYRKDELDIRYICGGTIISERLIVTAAHCVTDFDGKKYPPDNFLISAGKHYVNYTDDRDLYTQYASVNKIHVPTRFRGAIANYEADLAIILLNDNLKITLAVKPVCVDWDNNFEFEQLDSSRKGDIAAWSTIPNKDTMQEELQSLSVPYVPYEQCYEQVPRDFRRFLTYDKMCAGYSAKGVGVGKGDSGAGIAFKSSTGRYYLRGVLSTSPSKEGEPDLDTYATYTLLSKHIDFIKDIEITTRL